MVNDVALDAFFGEFLGEAAGGDAFGGEAVFDPELGEFGVVDVATGGEAVEDGLDEGGVVAGFFDDFVEVGFVVFDFDEAGEGFFVEVVADFAGGVGAGEDKFEGAGVEFAEVGGVVELG